MTVDRLDIGPRLRRVYAWPYLRSVAAANVAAVDDDGDALAVSDAASADAAVVHVVRDAAAVAAWLPSALGANNARAVAARAADGSAVVHRPLDAVAAAAAVVGPAIVAVAVHAPNVDVDA